MPLNVQKKITDQSNNTIQIERARERERERTLKFSV